MKIKPTSPGAHGNGRTYWRSLDELAQTAEFKQWVEREFPEGASEWTDPVSRRHFVKIMSASFLLAGLGLTGTGCRRPEQKIVPFAQKPENYVHGVAQFYASAMPFHGTAFPLVVRSSDGRPTKVEGNAMHPDSAGGTDRFVQASILNLYDPDRAMQFKERGSVRAPEAAQDFLKSLSATLRTSEGQGLAILLEPSNSPSRERLQRDLQAKLPKARWFLDEPVDHDIHRRSATLAFGQPVRPYYRFDQADVVLSLDADFLGSEAETANHIRRFTQRRHLQSPDQTPNRLYAVESLFTLTGINADHRLRVASSAVAQVARGVAAGVLAQMAGVSGVAGDLPSGVDPKWVAGCMEDLLAHRGKSLVVAGHRQPMVVHLLAHAMNAALGNIGQSVVYLPAAAGEEGNLSELAQLLTEGKVETLVILGGNPAYTAPADLQWKKAQANAKTVVRLGYYEDETFPLCQWHFPEAHYLESWGDARSADGTLMPIQPLIAPLFGGLTQLEVLARLGGLDKTDPYTIARDTFAAVSGKEDAGAWNRFLHDGFLANSAAQPVAVTFQPATLNAQLAEWKPANPSRDSLEVVFHRDYSLDDGRFNNNGWLQELPDPVTKIVWDNAVLLSRKTARDLGVENTDLVEVKLGEATVTGPVWVQPGQADYSLGLALGYGRQATGRVGKQVGFDAYPLRKTGAEHIAVGATVRKLGKRYAIACTQTHWSMDGRPAVREAVLKQYQEHPDFAKAVTFNHAKLVPMYPNPLDQVMPSALHQWGMAIDLNMCVGCSSCVIACQSENNVPIVGKDQVARGREMHWLRIDRYYTGRPQTAENRAGKPPLGTFEEEAEQQFAEWIDNPQAVSQPMMCQHCEAAPCENVCPVNATSHDHEGLNVMTYNRCVGTRYCSNNCPYKVRRFNFFDYNKRPLDKLYWGPLAKRPDDEWDLVRMIKNPDVTVRMRGVMEKCTFCLQRIEQAKITQKVKAGGSADVVVPEGVFTTACAQACPAGAIVFGNIADPQSRVSKLKAVNRNYSVLEELYTRPRTTYLARVRNPNPAMPDYYEAPFSFQEFEQKMGNPFKYHGHADEGGEKAAHSATKGTH